MINNLLLSLLLLLKSGVYSVKQLFTGTKTTQEQRQWLKEFEIQQEKLRWQKYTTQQAILRHTRKKIKD